MAFGNLKATLGIRDAQLLDDTIIVIEPASQAVRAVEASFAPATFWARYKSI